MKRVIKGANTNIYKTSVKPRILKKRKQSTGRGRGTRGGGVFNYLVKGLSNVKKKIPPSLVDVTKRAVKKGTAIAKQQLRNPQVQKAIQNAVTHGTNLATTHILKKAGIDNIPSSSTNKQQSITKRCKTKKGKRSKKKLLFE